MRNCRLCWRVALAVFVAIVAVEAAILVPSTLNYRRDLLERVEHVGLATVKSAFLSNSHFRDRDLLIVGDIVARQTEVAGGALYQPDGTLIGTFGERPQTGPAVLAGGDGIVFGGFLGDRYETLWGEAQIGLPYMLVARIESTLLQTEVGAFLWRILGLVLLISAAVTGAALLVVGRLVLVPTLSLRSRLVSAADDPENPDHYVLPVTRRDELGDVIGAFNGLIERIAVTLATLRQREDALTTANETLEQRVAERTGELSGANDQLRNEISVRRDAEERAVVNERRYRHVVNSVSDVIFQLDRQGRWTFLNRSWTDICGFTIDDTMGKPFLEYVHPDDQPQAKDALADLLDHSLPWRAAELRIITREGEERWVRLDATPLDENDHSAGGCAGRLDDISEWHDQQQQIHYLAHHDTLTDLPNRVLFHDRLRIALSQASRNREMLAVFFMDLDRFKDVNDTFGHAVGDGLLRAVANRLRSVVRASDTLARLGGNEFAVIGVGIDDSAGAAALAVKVMQVFAEPFTVDGHLLQMGATAGMAVYPGDSERPDELLQKAHLALYAAKDRERGVWQSFDPEMERALRSRKALEADLQRALERDEFEVHYQPQFIIATGKLCGVEALVRWRHPSRGLVSPDAFIPVAESSGLIRQLGNWVMVRACTDLAAITAAANGSPRIAVNISGVQIQAGDLSHVVGRALASSGIDAKRLELEITETVMVHADDPRIGQVLTELARMGIKISVDDFGTGYGSLTYLKRLPISRIKIDKSFVGGLPESRDDAEIVRALVDLGRNLNIGVTAEGIETTGQRDFLDGIGCEEGQGYMYAKPMPLTDLLDVLRQPENKAGDAA